MPHAFDSNSFGHLVTDAERLATRALEHEHALATLAELLEGDGAALLSTVQELRAGAREQRALAEKLRAGLVGPPAGTNGNGARRPLVLIVDDSKDNREIAAMLLETSGFDAITASNGLEGVIVAHNTRPAVVIMDVAMPVLDGIQATRLLRASPVTQEISVIAYTAKLNLDDDDTSAASLFEGVLSKPASPDEILSIVQRYAGAAGV